MSAGSGATNSIASPVVGWRIFSRRACRAWRSSTTVSSARSRGQLAARDLRAAAVQPIAQHRAADAGQVQANLMRAAGLGQAP